MRRLLTFLLILGCISVFVVSHSSVHAVPPLPSSFYGTVKFNGENFPEGTVVEALINGQVISQTQTLLYQGDSVYSMDVSGDDPSTTVVEGGQEADVIQFRVGGLVAAETGLWESGTNVALDLSITGSSSPEPPQATLTPMPTQTSEVNPTRTPTTGSTLAPTSRPTDSQETAEESAVVATGPQETENANTIDTVESNEATQETATTPSAQAEADEVQNNQEQGTKPSFLTVAIIAAIVLTIISVIIYWMLKKRRRKY